MILRAIDSRNARKNFYKLLKEVNETHQEIEIISDKEDYSVVLVSKDEWESIKETLYLERTGVMDTVKEREKDESGFTNITDIDWESL